MGAHAFRGAALCICIALCVAIPTNTIASVVDDLQQQLQAKKNALKSTQEKILEFNQRVQEKRRAAQTIQGQIEVLSDGIEAMTLSIQGTNAHIEETDAEIANVQINIEQKEKEIEDGKVLLAQYIRQMQELDEQSNLTIFLKYDTLSDALKESSTVQELQERAHKTIVSITSLRDDLVEKQEELEGYKQKLDQLKARQKNQQATLAAQNSSKKQILNLTRAEQAQFQSQLEQAKQDAKKAEAAISDLDSKIREQLRAQGAANFGSVGLFDWPIDPIFGISCSFHCGGYPYEYLIGPHSGTDMPTGVGTPIHAPADGYVARTHDSGGRGYSYIMLIHGDNLSTVYGHVSGFAVAEGKYVKRGNVIGYTGGAYGMRGSGLSTGAHLHFEVRKNNIPVNAELYLKRR